MSRQGVRDVSLERIVSGNLRVFLRSELGLRRGLRVTAMELWRTLGQRETPNPVSVSPHEALALVLGGRARHYTYFVSLLDRGRVRFVKIGASDDPTRRVEDLRTACPFELHLVAAVPELLCGERQLHRHFRAIRRHREWFAATKRLRRFLDEVLALDRRAAWLWRPA
jgi:hypothetical protein